MSGKKNNALERELLDDLIEGTSNSVELESDSTSPSVDSAPISPSAEPLATIPDLGLTSPLKTDEATIRLNQTRAVETTDIAAATRVAGAGRVDDEVRASVGRFGAFRNTSSPTGAALAQSENLRIAQSRIMELEQEVERLRIENEELGAAGETFRRKADELVSQTENLGNRLSHAVQMHAQEKQLLLETRDSLRRDLDQAKRKNEEMELRLSTNVQKIRVRERELENRLELVKMEGAALIRSKDEMVLDLKRQIDQLGLELNNYRSKGQELNRMLLDKQDILRRTVKALRLALTMLEGDDEATSQKKAK